MTTKHREWSPPQGLIIQPGAILVPGRVGYVPDEWFGRAIAERLDIEGGEHGRLCLMRRFCLAGQPIGASIRGPDVQPVSVARWDLSSLTSAEIDSLQLAIDAQRQRGIGQPCAATVADRRALGLLEQP